MRHTLLASMVGGLIIGACATAPDQEDPAPVPEDTMPAAPPANATYLPPRTHMQVALDVAVGPGISRIGDVFTARVAEAITAVNGDTVVATGTTLTGMVTGADEAGDGPAIVRLNFLRADLRGVTHPFTAQVVRTSLAPDTPPAEEPGTQPAAGVVIRGELREAMVQRIGVGAGTIISLGTSGAAVLPAGTRLTVRTMDPLDLRR